MEMIADTGRVSSVDVMELNPAYDERNRTAELTVASYRRAVGAPA